MKVKDISLNYFRFYLNEKDGDKKVELEEKDKLFRVVLNSAVKEIGDWAKTRQQNEPNDLRKKGVNLLLASSFESSQTGYWVKGEESFYRKVIARSRLDVFILQTGVLKQAVSEDSELEHEIKKLPKFTPPENKHSLKSVCQCVFLELENYQNTDSLDTVFANVFKGLGYENPFSRKIDLGFGCVAILENNSEAIWAVVPSNATSVNKASTFVNDILYQYFLAFSKVMSETITVQKDLDNAKNFKYQLADYLKTNLSKTPKSLFAMEKAEEKLADLRIGLAVEMARARRHINTININVGNVEKLLESAYLIGKKEELDKLLLNPLRLVREQIEADLSYCEIDLEKGNLINEKLEDITQIRLAQWSRKATLFFGFLSAIGILQLFPIEFGENANLEFTFSWKAFFYKPFWVKFALITGLIVVFLIIAFRDEILGLFSRGNKPEADNQKSAHHTNRQLPSGTQDYIVADDEKEKVKITN